MGINKFSDLTEEEFKKHYTGGFKKDRAAATAVWNGCNIFYISNNIWSTNSYFLTFFNKEHFFSLFISLLPVTWVQIIKHDCTGNKYFLA